MAISIVRAVPNLGIASCMGSHLGKSDHRNFLSPHCYSLGFSPPPLPPVLPGSTLHRKVLPAVVRRKRRANLHVDSCHCTASSSPIPPPHLESWLPLYPESSSLTTPLPLPLPHPKRFCDKNPEEWAELSFAFICGQILFPDLAVHQNHVGSVKSTVSCIPGLLTFGNWATLRVVDKLPGVYAAEPGLRSTGVEDRFLRGGGGCWCQIFLETIFKICVHSPRWFWYILPTLLETCYLRDPRSQVFCSTTTWLPGSLSFNPGILSLGPAIFIKKLFYLAEFAHCLTI